MRRNFWGFRINVPFQGYLESGHLADLPFKLDEASSTRNEEKHEIAYARSLDVHQLDATLPSMRLEDWLRSGPNIGSLIWRLSPTGDLKPTPTDDRDYESCVKFIVLPKGYSGFFTSYRAEGMIKVGTLSKGMSGTPKLQAFGVGTPIGASKIDHRYPSTTTRNYPVFLSQWLKSLPASRIASLEDDR